MQHNGEAHLEREAIQKTTDGKNLLLRRLELSPLAYDDHNAYCRGLSVEIIMWLLTAAGSGVIGNLTYDAAKRLIKKTRRLHLAFLARFSKEDQQDNDWGIDGLSYLP